MTRFLLRRVLETIPLLLLLSLLVFLLFELIPGDFLTEMELDPTVSSATIQQLREDYGLERPFYARYFIWASQILRGNLGYSFAQRRPAIDLVMERLFNGNYIREYPKMSYLGTIIGTMKEHKAPGKSHRKGLSIKALFKMFPDDSTAEKWFVKSRWPNGIACPDCGSLNVQTGASHPTMPYRCRDCRKRFSAKTGTALEGSKLGFQVWMIAIYLLATGIKGTSSMKLHRDLEITQKSAWFIAHRIREAWKSEGGPLSGPVEVDETFIGGKERNKHSSKKSRAGRGTVGKTPVVGVKDRETKRVLASVVRGTTREDLEGFIQERVEPGSTVYTDDHSGYCGLWLSFEHRTVRHSVKEYVKGQAHTNGIESFWALLKRGYYGTFHKMSAKHLQRYCDEFAGRHNERELDTIDQMKVMVRGMDGKRLKYRELVA